MAIMVTDQHYLYILVRNDMESLGRGKSVAQGAHAANQFIWDEVLSRMIDATRSSTVNKAALEWSREANGFGTTIALSASLAQMNTTVQIAKALGFPASLVSDPEYPLVDGPTVHLIPNVVTTAYVFGTKDALRPILQNFKLLSNDPHVGL